MPNFGYLYILYPFRVHSSLWALIWGFKRCSSTQCQITSQGWGCQCHHGATASSPWRDRSHGPRPHGPGHRRRAVSQPRHQPPRALLLHRRKCGTPPLPQGHLHIRTFRQVLTWAGPHSCVGLYPSPQHYHWRRSRSWLLSYNWMDLSRHDPEDWQWQVALGHTTTHHTAGRQRYSLSQTPHAYPPPPPGWTLPSKVSRGWSLRPTLGRLKWRCGRIGIWRRWHVRQMKRRRYQTS